MMLSHVVVDPESIHVDGLDVSSSCVGVEILIEPLKPAEVILHVAAEAHLDLQAAVYLMQEPSPEVIFRRMKELISEFDPAEVESQALEVMQWGEDQRLSAAILKTIGEVLQYAIDELDPTEEVRGSTDDRHDQSDEVGTDSN